MHLPQVVMVSRLRNTIMNIDKQADVADLITCQRSIAVLLLQYKLSLTPFSINKCSKYTCTVPS